MRQMCLGLIGVLATVAAAVALSPGLAAGQAPTATEANKGTTLRTPWGDSDLQGTWTNTTTTPFERADDPVPAAEGTDSQPTPSDYDPHVSSVGAYNDFFFERGGPSSQPSLVVDPPHGKLPPLTPEAKQFADEVEALRRLERPASWEELNPYDRCITRGVPGAMIPGFYNHNYQIVQTPSHVAILVEMIHDVRIIPLDGRPHLGARLPQWMGNSRGRWEGQTLVVETTNFNNKIREFAGNSQRLPNGEPVNRYQAAFGTPTLTLVERFTRIDADTIDYRFTVTDPATHTRDWTVVAPMTKIEGPLYEYACHEGNHALPNMLRSARAQE